MTWGWLEDNLGILRSTLDTLAACYFTGDRESCFGKILQNFVAFSEYMNFKLLDKIHKNWPQWASDPPRPAIEAQNRPTNLRGQEAEPRDFALLQKKYLSSSTENPNFRSINLGLTYTFLVVRNITYALPHLL